MSAAPATRHIGGFFELELPAGGRVWHPDALALSTGRACIAAILQHTRPRLVRVPFYVCDAVLVPMREAGTPVEFYALDERLQPVDLPALAPGEMVLAVNYFGLQSALMRDLAQRYGGALIADNAHAFFERPGSGHWALWSARKCFGVPDGAYLHAPEAMRVRPAPNPRSEVRHLVNRLLGRQQVAYRQMQRHERRMDTRIRAMSPLSARLLAAVDYERAQRRRRANYLALHALLGEHNEFDAALPAGATPFCYPLLLPRPVERSAMARHRLYVATLWRDVIERSSPPGFDRERRFAAHLLPLPVDHRYTTDEMEEAVRRLRKAVSL